ncbi:hypothetical protein MKK64_19000 [Methylobacterium sp. E-025]|uniref:hypothetical protein n=1 Tax=Methylobacterium sp. E-025 TaxID=2836561 RepID=UPI001FB8B567|nr:hypothetical protein [Methylobacterium sp. E-025]MCJ2113270.1 hypothetical protein [Methylobacterium sp. E-025]
MERHTLSFTDFEGIILRDALTRECRVLDIVTAKEREAGNRDAWALARIKFAAARGLISQAVRDLPWEPGGGHQLLPEDQAELADRIAAVGQKMRPPRAVLEEQMTVKARRRAAVRKAQTAGTERAGSSKMLTAAEPLSEEPHKLPWTAPKCK